MIGALGHPGLMPGFFPTFKFVPPCALSDEPFEIAPALGCDLIPPRILAKTPNFTFDWTRARSSFWYFSPIFVFCAAFQHLSAEL